MLKQRVATALVALAILALVLFVLPQAVARLVIAAIILTGAWEWGGFLFRDSASRRGIYAAFVALAGAALLYRMPDAALLDVVLKTGLGWWCAALVWLFFYPTRIPLPVSWVAGALLLVPAWMALDYLYMRAPELLLFALLIVWFADIGAYFVGRGFGRVKLAPQISPGKTWEGVLGALTAVTVLAAAGAWFLTLEVAVLVPFCLAVTMLSIVGDLTVSMFKRTAGVKDSGTLFPGHGGVLDRIDSVTAAAPLFAVALPWIGL